MNHDNFAFVIELATDSSKNAEFKQMIKMNEKTIQINTKYESSDYNYEFSIGSKNEWNTESFPYILKLTESIHGKGGQGFEATTLMEIQMEKQTNMEECRILLQANPQQTNTHFKITWTTTLTFIKEY